MSISPFEFDSRSTQAQRDKIRPALEEAAALIGPRLASITLVPKPTNKMPDWDSSTPGVQPAWGLWKGWNRNTSRREIWYWEEAHLSKDIIGLIQHEVFHAYDDLYMHGRPEMYDAVMALMHPEATFWSQGKTWSKFPFECAAVYGSAAMFDIAKPPYTRLLDRKILPGDWPALKAILLG